MASHGLLKATIFDTHEWNHINDGILTIKRTFKCDQCGTVVDLQIHEGLSEAIRRCGISDNCNHQMVTNIMND